MVGFVIERELPAASMAELFTIRFSLMYASSQLVKTEEKSSMSPGAAVIDLKFTPVLVVQSTSLMVNVVEACAEGAAISEAKPKAPAATMDENLMRFKVYSPN